TIKIDDLHKSYGENKALNGLNLDIEKGEIYGFLGPNGAGKTTAIKIILGLVKPDKGDITIHGEDALGNSMSVREKTGYLPEKLEMYEGLTVNENLEFLCELKGCPNEDIEKLLEEFEMENWRDKKLKSLSKGMLQRVGFLQTTIGNPDLYILDEPTSGLDPKVRRWVKDKILYLKKMGKTIFLSSHILSEIQELCDRVGFIKEGKLIAEGDVDTFFDDLEMYPRLELKINQPIEAFKNIEELDYVHRPRLVDEKLTLYCQEERKMDVIKLFLDKGFEISDFTVKKPDLEEVFVKLTEEG
ncbi:MAG: ABC transporter ATP-binding protein, partial [Thermoplasmatota archaeon]